MDYVNTPRVQRLLFALFALSGFSGLIYESIWTHYIKLFLGHAAHAQTLVLALFMGGMAAGAWLAGRRLSQLRNPLLAYAAVEVAIGLFGLGFHRVFVASSGWMLDSVLPALGDSAWSEPLRWGCAALLILPQTLLLGATFPLMSAGLLRAFPQMPGSTISLLYFTNSLGAVAGVLCSGFWLVGQVGLPGTLLTAALVNFLLAIAVYGCGKRLAPGQPATVPAGSLALPERLLLAVALVTGLSSFIYEIGWIRMLSLVLGASTHAFELMLAAFILGLALGGLWIRRRIDRLGNPLLALAVVQLLMGALALGTVVGYNHLFDVMRFVIQAVQPSDAGYLVFNVASHLIAMLLMLPVTFMAGMTLPLITFVLFQRGSGERALGRVYAANTLGAIIGVALAMQLLLPFLGLKAAITLGAALDLLLGIWLLQRVPVRPALMAGTLLGVVALMLGVSMFTRFDTVRMASGVYRHGQFPHGESLFHRDGRTATVDVQRYGDGTVSIITNGKPDASVMMDPRGAPREDEPTMVLTGGLPLLYHPSARTAAVIGMGSGLSASVVLSSPVLERLDLIEIEAAMMEGARLFGPRVAPVYADPRSHVHIDDAKSYFAAHQSRYDIIISEPSNPWVSGVANLFSEEFYRRVRTHLNDDGLLVQWFQLYETNPDIVNSILKAMTPYFEDYVIYTSSSGDIVLAARKTGKLPPPSDLPFRSAAFRAEFNRARWFTLADVEAHRLVDRAALLPLLQVSSAPANSDFFPYVDQHAVAARFKHEQASFLPELARASVPFPGPYFRTPPAVTDGAWPIGFPPRADAIQGRRLAAWFARPSGPVPALPEDLARALALLRTPLDCRDDREFALWLEARLRLASGVLPWTDAAAARPLLAALGRTGCADPSGRARDWLALLAAVAARDLPAQAAAAERLLGRRDALPDARSRDYALEAALVARQQLGDDVQVLRLARAMPAPTPAMDLMALGAAARETARQPAH